MKISEMVDEAYNNAKAKGFYNNWNAIVLFDDERNTFITAQLMRVVSEAAEAMQALEIGDMENFAEELSDILLRVASLCGLLGIDLENGTINKIAKNKLRGYLHGKQF